MEDEVNLFVEKMKEKYNSKVQQYGDSWKYSSFEFLDNRLTGEFIEYVKSGNPRELLDIANVCWMIYVRKTGEVKQ